MSPSRAADTKSGGPKVTHFDDEPPDFWPTDEELADYGYIRTSNRVRSINSTPRVGQCFWVDFPHDAYAPEFVREHPGVVVRAAQKLDHDTCIIVPLTTSEQKAAPHNHRLSRNPNPKDNRPVWAVCDHLYTVNLGRLRAIKNKTGQPTYPKVLQADLEAIFAAIRVALHHVYGSPDLPSVAASAPAQAPAGPAVVVVKSPKRRVTSKPEVPPAKKVAPKKAAPKKSVAKKTTSNQNLGPSGKPILTLKKKDEG